jgi:hypothetical protein
MIEKKIPIVVCVTLLIMFITGCVSVGDVIGKATSGVISDSTEGAVSGVTEEKADFKTGEVLCALSPGDLLESDFLLGKVLTPPSKETKNQAEVVFTSNGDKKWVYSLVPSHVATKEDVKIGAVLMFPSYAQEENISSDDYRKRTWHMGRVSSFDELFKGLVEINGEKKYLRWLRVPEVKVE